MTSGVFLAFLVGVGQGALHGIGPDHCAAIVTLGTAGGPGDHRRALRTALRFALGHTGVLGMLAFGCLLAGLGISEAFERYAEMLGGAVLVALALAALFFPGAFRHGHPHLPGHAHDRRHPRLTTAAGALMAISGARSLLLALPPLLLGTSVNIGAWAYLPGFALGLLGSMGTVGLLVSLGAARLTERAHTRLEQAVALGSAALGVSWIAQRL